MTPAERLNQLSARLNDHSGRGGKTRLASLLEWDYSTLWRKLNKKSPVTKSDVLAAEAAVSRAKRGAA